MKITILLADDHPIVRAGLRLILEAESNLRIIKEVETGRDAVQQAAQQCPDVVIMDIIMPDLNGIEATRQIREMCPTTRVIMLSIQASTNHILRALKAGASAYLLKGAANNEVVEAIRAVYAGQRYFSQKISDQLREELKRHDLSEVEEPLEKLSAREREVLQLVVEGNSSAEIATMLNLSVKTVETYRYRLMQKLDISDIPALVKFAIQYGLTPPE